MCSFSTLILLVKPSPV